MQATAYLGADKIELKDGAAMIVNAETIGQTVVTITEAHSGGDVSISEISINMTAEDDLYVFVYPPPPPASEPPPPPPTRNKSICPPGITGTVQVSFDVNLTYWYNLSGMLSPSVSTICIYEFDAAWTTVPPHCIKYPFIEVPLKSMDTSKLKIVVNISTKTNIL